VGEIRKMAAVRDLSSRRPVTVTLPEFLLQTLERRLEKANQPGAVDKDDAVTLDHLIELELAETISISEVALLEPEIPGIGAAVSRWLHEIE
jgi:hypothetical protein